MSDSSEIEWFASYCIMTKGANPGGHAFIMLSSYDPNKNRIIVTDRVGYYSKKLPILGFAPFSNGIVVNEKVNWLAKRKGLFQLTWPISIDEYETLHEALQRDVIYSKINEGDTQPFPSFNLFKHACKSYALNMLEKTLDINLAALTNTVMDLPKLSGKVFPLKIRSEHPLDTSSQQVYSQQMTFRIGAKPLSNRSVQKVHEDFEVDVGNNTENSAVKSIEPQLFWSIPLVVIPRGNLSDAQKLRYQAWSQFNFLYFGLKHMINQLSKLLDNLDTDHLDRPHLERLNHILKNKANLLKPFKQDPLHVTDEFINDFLLTISALNADIQCTRAQLQQKSIADFLLDWLKICLNALNPLAWLNNHYPALSIQGTLDRCENHFKKLPTL